MVLNVNTLMLLAISVIRVALRGPLEWVLCLDAFHLAGRFMYAVQPSLISVLPKQEPLEI